MVLLIHLELFDRALRVINKKKYLFYEKAYCYYRLSLFQSALSTVQLVENSLRKDLLTAQILFRMEQYEEALEIFLKHKTEGEEILVNITACQTFLNADNIAQGDSCEAYFNAGCHSIQIEDFENGQNFFKKAESTASAEELTMIHAQQCYMEQVSGESDLEARYAELIETSKGQTKAILLNNLGCLTKDMKHFEMAFYEASSLWNFQKRILNENLELVGLDTRKLKDIMASKSNVSQVPLLPFDSADNIEIRLPFVDTSNVRVPAYRKSK